MSSLRIKIISAIAVILVVTGIGFFFTRQNSTAATNSNSSSSNTPIKLGYLPNANSLPFFTAQQKGFFKEQNLNVELVEFASSQLAIDAITRGDIVGACCGASFSAVNANLTSPNTLKLWFVSDERAESGYNGLVLNENINLGSITDLENKKIGVQAGPLTSIFTAYLKSQNLDTTKVSLIPIDPKDQLQALQAGSVDGLFTFEPVLAQSESKKIGKIYQRGQLGQLYPNPIMGAGYLAVNNKLEASTLNSLNQALNKAIEYNKTNSELALRESASFLKVEPDLAAKIKKFDFYTINQTPVDELQRFTDFLTEIKIVKSKSEVKDLVYKL